MREERKSFRPVVLFFIAHTMPAAPHGYSHRSAGFGGTSTRSFAPTATATKPSRSPN
jgi:hypothetical protein